MSVRDLREADALAEVYDLLRAIGRRQSDQLSALAEAERKPQPNDTDDEPSADEQAA